MQRYFIENKQIKDNLIYIDGGDYHHIKNVMRMKLEDFVEACDQDQNVYNSKITEINKENIVLEIIDKSSPKVELPTNITIALGLTRNSKLDEVLRRITELGASGFIPVEMKRSVVRINKERDSKIDRMNLIVKEAAEQSKRTKLLEVSSPMKLKNLLNQINNYDILVYAYEELGKKTTDTSKSFKDLAPTFLNKKVLVLVGPEGGFDPLEVKELNEKGFIPVGLGPRILRLETAPLYLMSVISYELEL